MKMIKTLSFDCSMCYGKGYLYYGGAEDWNIDPCDCNPNPNFDGDLFSSGLAPTHHPSNINISKFFSILCHLYFGNLSSIDL